MVLNDARAGADGGRRQSSGHQTAGTQCTETISVRQASVEQRTRGSGQQRCGLTLGSASRFALAALALAQMLIHAGPNERAGMIYKYFSGPGAGDGVTSAERTAGPSEGPLAQLREWPPAAPMALHRTPMGASAPEAGAQEDWARGTKDVELDVALDPALTTVHLPPPSQRPGACLTRYAPELAGSKQAM
ncbi:MAG: hypothetical protein M1821_005348 [Bathelium mastoideum]|nr:MAG: hypothetical protein M1821_005348 [Bathelium mastoideum]KAI9688102.1 MAG: hypothetical protein M1822_001608 [Bathelium mastoideum]